MSKVVAVLLLFVFKKTSVRSSVDFNVLLTNFSEVKECGPFLTVVSNGVCLL